jgi:hypothetical protein
VSRGPAIWATAVALALTNAGLAAIIAEVIGVRTFGAVWVGAVLLGVGIVAAVGAVLLWRQYLAEARRGYGGERAD